MSGLVGARKVNNILNSIFIGPFETFDYEEVGNYQIRFIDFVCEIISQISRKSYLGGDMIGHRLLIVLLCEIIVDFDHLDVREGLLKFMERESP